MDYISLLGTAYGRRWAKRRSELDSLIAKGLELPEIAEELRAARIHPAEVARAVREKGHLAVRYLMARGWSQRLISAAQSTTTKRYGRRWVERLPPMVGLLISLVVLPPFLTVLPSDPNSLPLALQLLLGLGLAGVGTLVWWIAKDDVRMVFRTVQSSQDPLTWTSDFVEYVVVPELRQYIAEQREPVYGTELSVDRPNLNDDREALTIVTSAGHQLQRILNRLSTRTSSRLPGEAVALAGPRGAGKTTMIRAIAGGLFSNPNGAPPLAVVAAAPSRYEARDFVLHLHVLLCRRVIALTSALLLLPTEDRRSVRNGWRHFRWPAGGVLLLGLLGGTATALWPGSFGELISSAWHRANHLDQLAEMFAFAPTTTGRERAALAIGVGMIFGAGLMTAVLLMTMLPRIAGAGWQRIQRRRREKRYPGLAELRMEAFEQLRRIRFLQTYTTGWSGKIGLPLGSDTGWNVSMQRAEQNLTHPEVVESFRLFAEQSAADLISVDVIERLVIAIDEVDKIAEPAQAHELLNDVKGIFGVPNCLFLVSVSDDAMSAFERRGIPVRDAFDSAFTQMVRMDHFTLAESRRWLSRRLIGVPEQFTYLLHCLSGGLPRELRRMTIELVDIVAEEEQGDLAHVTGVLLDRELDRKIHAFAAAARRCEDTTERSSYLALLTTVPTADDHAPLASKLAPGEEAGELRGVRWQSACFLLFCATVREIFTNMLDESRLDGRLESLAVARAQLAVDPQVAWRLVESARAAFSLG